MHIIRASRIFIILGLSWIATASQHARSPRADSHPHNTPLKDAPVVVTVNLQQSLNTITDHFIGHSLGYPLAINLSHHFSSQKLKNLARELAPAFARVFGDGATYWVGRRKRGITPQLWDSMNNFFETSGWDLIMILDALKRHKDGSWNPDNARQLLQFSAQKNFTIAGFELGNEYDIYGNPFKTVVTPEQLAKDVLTLQKVLSEFPNYYSSFIMGPDTAYVNPHYFQGFLAAGASKAVRAASFHQYYFSGHHGNLSYFTDIKTMDNLGHVVDQAFKQSRSVDPLLPVWLSETGSAGAGGVEGMTDRFLSGFLWLDKLGVCAAKGIQVVMRHVFYGKHYGILDSNLDPNPDYWLTVLYKRIVRGAVFHASGRHDVRVYAACADTDNFSAGSLAIYILNPNNNPVTFDLPQFTHQPRLRYSLTPGDQDGLVSKYVSLNGVKLQLVNDTLPPLKPESAPPGMVTVPAYSYTFLVFPEARVSICLT
ncbi:heparanase-like [Littorina saxatilis]